MKSAFGQNSDAGRIAAIILTTQRTGSTFLVECLDSHPQIECAGEILNGAPDTLRIPYRGPFRPIVKAVDMFRYGAWRPVNRMSGFFAGGCAKARIFKAMYNQLRMPFALRYLQGHEEIRILHLRRHNLLKVHVSTLLMSKRRLLHVTKPVAPIRIRVDPAAAVSSMRSARSCYERFEKLFARHAHLALTYESLFDGPLLQAETGASICNFLGVMNHAMKSSMVKLNPDSLRSMVTNYDELAGAVSRTEFADMLD